MKLKFTLFALLVALAIQAQDCPPPTALVTLEGNNIKTVISNGGDLFWEGEPSAGFIVPADDLEPKSTIYAAGLWMAGLDPGGNLEVAAQAYGRASGLTDYAAGPLSQLGIPFDNYCEVFDKIWVVYKSTVEAHLADYADNGIIDNPLPRIFGWPGKGNAFFENYHPLPWPVGTHPDTYAPFFDSNGDGIYQPDQGEYPFHPAIEEGLFPYQLTWTVFNDATIHTSSGATSLQAEIQLSSWNFECSDNELLNNTVFTSHTIRNAGIEWLDSFYVGLWMDFDLGCHMDDYVGSAPGLNTFFAYNIDNLDGLSSALDCNGSRGYGENPPVQSVTFLNKPLDVFTLYNNFAVNPEDGTEDPVFPREYYNYLTGSWRDGTPLTYGGDGYDTASTNVVSHLYSEDPNIPDSWSMKGANIPVSDIRPIGSHKVGHLNIGEAITLDIAYTYHREDGANHVENVTAMYSNVAELQGIYENRFAGVCGDAILSNSNVIPASAYQLSPNPTKGIVELNLGELQLEQLRVFDLSGKLMMEFNELSGQQQLDFSRLQRGMYLLHMQTENQIATEKVVVIH